MGEESEKDATVIVIQTNWPKLEATANELEETMTVLSDTISKATTTTLREDPNTLIENQRKYIEVICEEYRTFREQNAKEIRDIKKTKIQIGNTENEVTVVRESNSQKT